MNPFQMLPGFQALEEPLPGLSDARELLASQQNGLSDEAEILRFIDGLLKRRCPWTHILCLVRCVVRAKARASPPASPASPSPTPSPGNDGDEIDLVTSRMEPGKTYSITQLMAFLPSESRIFDLETELGRKVQMGYLMRTACEQGKAMKVVPSRSAKYSLPRSSK